MRISNSAIMTMAVATLAFVLGFAYGNLFAEHYGIELYKWQPLMAASIALAVGALAFFGVIRNMRVNILTREEDRIENELPGLRKACTLISILRLRLARRPHEDALNIFTTTLGQRPGESVEEAFERQITLAKPNLKRELGVTLGAMFQLLAEQTAIVNELRMIADASAPSMVAENPGSNTDMREFEERLRSLRDTQDEVVEMLARMASELGTRIKSLNDRANDIRLSLDSFFSR
jgi:hypothetical protein